MTIPADNSRRPIGIWAFFGSLILLLLICNPASAITESVEIGDIGYKYNSGVGPSGQTGNYNIGNYPADVLFLRNAEYLYDVNAIFYRSKSGASYGSFPENPQSFTVNYQIGEKIVGSGRYGTYQETRNGQIYHVVWLSFENLNLSGYSGLQTVKIVNTDTQGVFPRIYNVYEPPNNWGTWNSSYHRAYIGGKAASNYNALWQYAEIYYTTDFKNRYTISETINGWHDFYLQRQIDGKTYPSMLYITAGDVIISGGSTAGTSDTLIENIQGTPITVSIKSTAGKWYNQTFDAGGADPGETPPEPGFTNRTGTVTMTDNNGTTITGFEVTAENAYTGESYTVATETDVAVMTLPMDRTIRLRNPQTGEYEDAPVGYYKFYGQSPGYKMLNEDGIKVSVMPEKYGSYQLCDILVTSESGYLTGNHKFQIRSRADNSILQTGTVSAKSATTGEWYNATVSGGIASIILPYDTSNVVSQYAGNYYVYATSPGYEDSEYGTQITVMPHTAYEIRDILLTPIGGVPTPGNVTLRIHAFSETGPGVVNAEIFIAGVLGAGSDVWDTYIASSTGYLTVSVPGNSTYDIVASGAGFYDSARRVTVYDDDPPLIEIKLYLSGAPTVEPTTQPTGWPTTQPTTQPTGGIPDEDDDSESFIMQAVRGIGLAFGVGFATAKLIFGMLLALSIGYATAKQLRGGAAEFGLGLLGGTLLGVLIGLLPVWIIVMLLLVVGLYIGNRYVGGGNNG